jgi:type IV secretion system protein VirB6
MGDTPVFLWLGHAVDALALGYITEITSKLTAWLTGIAAAGMALWLAITGSATASGLVANPVGTLTSQAFKKVWILVFALNAALFSDSVVRVTDAMANGFTGLFAPENTPLTGGGGAAGGGGTASVWTVLADFDATAWALVVKVAKGIGMNLKFPVVFLALLLFSVGNLAIECIALYVCLVAKIHRTFILAVGPLFILTLLHKESSGFFKGWLHLLASTVVLLWMVFFALGFAMYVSGYIAEGVTAGLDADNLLKLAGSYCAILIGLAWVLLNAPAWSAAMTGGAPMQLGTSVMQSAANTYLLAKGGKGGSTPNLPNTAGNNVGYALGHMAGSAVQTAYQRMAALGRSNRT